LRGEKGVSVDRRKRIAFFRPLNTSRLTPLKSRIAHLFKVYKGFMREIIIRDVSPDDAQSIRRLQAVEGYADLGMFQEAAEELRQVDPAWFRLEQIARLQLRVFAGLNQCI